MNKYKYIYIFLNRLYYKTGSQLQAEPTYVESFFVALH